MRIVYVTAGMPFSFVETFLIPEAVELLRMGHQLLIVPRSSGPGEVHKDAEAVKHVAIRQGLISFEICWTACRVLLSRPWALLTILTVLMQSRSPGVFLKNCIMVPKSLWLVQKAIEFKAEHIHCHWASTTATMAMLASMISGIPWSVTAHRNDIVENNLLKLKLSHAAFVRFISWSGQELARKVISSDLPGDPSVIRMGVDIEEHSNPLNDSNWCPVFCCPANLYPVKGHRHLIAAAAILKARNLQFKIEIIGDGMLKSQLQALTASLNVCDRVSFLGQKPHNEILDRLQRRVVGVVILPSVDLGNGVHEGVPVSLMEAMAHEVPVISTSTGGIPELLGNDAGIIVPPADPEALADAMQLLLQDPEARSKYASAGRRKIQEEFEVTGVVKRLSDAITKRAA